MTRDADPSVEERTPLKPVVFEICLALAEGPKHGYAILQDVRARSGGGIRLETGPLYRHLKRLHDDGLVQETATPVDESSSDPRRRYYGLTPLGRAVVASEGRRLAETVQKMRALGVLPS